MFFLAFYFQLNVVLFSVFYIQAIYQSSVLIHSNLPFLLILSVLFVLLFWHCLYFCLLVTLRKLCLGNGHGT